MLKGIHIHKPIFHINVYNHHGWCFLVLDCMKSHLDIRNMCWTKCQDSVSVDYAWISGIFVGHLDLFMKKKDFCCYEVMFLRKKKGIVLASTSNSYNVFNSIADYQNKGKSKHKRKKNHMCKIYYCFYPFLAKMSRTTTSNALLAKLTILSHVE